MRDNVSDVSKFAVRLMAAGMLAAALAAGPAMAEEIVTHSLTAPNGPSVTLTNDNGYMPDNLLFFPAKSGKPLTVAVKSVRLIGLPTNSATCDPIPDEMRQAMLTTIKRDKGSDVTLTTAVVAGKSVVHLELTGFKGEMAISLSGADRASFPQGTGFETMRLAGLSRTIMNKDLPNRVSFQDSRSQDGVVIRCSANGEMRLVSRYPATEVLVKSDGRPLSVTLTGFRGDASLAIESAAAPTVSATSQGSAIKPHRPEWVFFSNEGRAFRPLLADQREARLRAGFSHGQQNGDIHADLVFGGDVGLKRREWSNGDVDTLTVRGLLTGRLNMNTESKDVMNNDYYGGVAYGRRFGRDSWEVYMFHESAHLGDETLDFGKRKRIDYGREAVRLLYSRQYGNLRVYGGPTHNFTASSSFNRNKTALQAGAEYEFIGLWDHPMYVAGDVHVREENKWKPHVTAQVGVELGNPDKVKRRRTRLFLELYTGYSNMGQYWNEYETTVMVGVGFDW